MRNEEMLPGNCSIEKRANYSDPRVSFAICNDTKLLAQNAVNVARSTVAIAKAVFGNGDWSDVADAWQNSAPKYHDIFTNKKVGDFGVMLDIHPVYWNVVLDLDAICVDTMALFGLTHLGCKYLTEPFPTGKYASFFTRSVDGSEDIFYKDKLNLVSCSGGTSCYLDAVDHSRSAFNIVTPIAHCVLQMSRKLFFKPQVCSTDSMQMKGSYIESFQENMRNIVYAIITLCIAFFGISIILQKAKFHDGITLIIKIMAVLYVGVGFKGANGLQEIIIPLIFNGMDELKASILQYIPSHICSFDSSNYQAPFKQLAFLNTIDCRLAHHIGLVPGKVGLAFWNIAWLALIFTIVGTVIITILREYLPPEVIKILSNGLVKLRSEIFMPILFCALMVPLLVVDIVVYITYVTVSAVILGSVLCFLSPIFVPCILFKATTNAFHVWVKSLILVIVKPTIAVILAVFAFSMLDTVWSASCKYQLQTKQVKLSSPKSQTDSYKFRTIQTYVLDTNWDHYSEQEKKSCKASMDFFLSSTLGWLYLFFDAMTFFQGLASVLIILSILRLVIMGCDGFIDDLLGEAQSIVKGSGTDSVSQIRSAAGKLEQTIRDIFPR
ncbi:hypothetical protein [Candidatus Sarmatiella mevalonica]|uniref:hypothetical protein n=1 Tax=Candidatus Sarmatiella mevalonica TaxID=2770581 RepID=UPI001924EE43|nr:hypothetical protein [Candidatus Sarmatiella mevalonica]